MSSTQVRKRPAAKKKPEQSRQNKGVYKPVSLKPRETQTFKWTKCRIIALTIVAVVVLTGTYLTIASNLNWIPFSSHATNVGNNLTINDELAVASMFKPSESRNSSIIDKLFPKSLTKINEHHLREYPHLSGIVLTNGIIEELGCRGTLVNLSPFIKTAAIITAAHCHINNYNATISKVYYFDPAINETVIVPATEFDIYPYPKFQFGNLTHSYDVLIIILKYRLVDNAACLPEVGVEPPNNMTLVDFVNSSKIYRGKVEVTTIKKVSNEECRKDFSKWYADIKFDDRFCADHGGKYTEVGSSGASLTSWNGKCHVIHGLYSTGSKVGFTTFDIYMKMKPLKQMIQFLI